LKIQISDKCVLSKLIRYPRILKIYLFIKKNIHNLLLSYLLKVIITYEAIIYITSKEKISLGIKIRYLILLTIVLLFLFKLYHDHKELIPRIKDKICKLFYKKPT
jgi:hypothetical protein